MGILLIYSVSSSHGTTIELSEVSDVGLLFAVLIQLFRWEFKVTCSDVEEEPTVETKDEYP